MPRGVLSAAAAVGSVGAALVIGNASALPYQSGTIGFDISYPQCNKAYPTNTRLGAPPAVTPHAMSVTVRPLAVMTQTTTRADGTPPGRVSQPIAPVTLRPSAPSVPARGFGIVGVDSGNPFISSTHPGNPCMADEYVRSPNPALYVNTGYDPS